MVKTVCFHVYFVWRERMHSTLVVLGMKQAKLNAVDQAMTSLP